MRKGIRIVSTAPNHDSTLRTRLQRSRLDLAEVKELHQRCEQRLATVQQELMSQEKANRFLQRKLIRLQKKIEAANYLAYHDALTGLPNRRLLLDRLNQAIAQAARQKRKVALVFFDVDGFKEINDTLGHGGGDQLLQGVAQRLGTCLRSADTACRYGGDEFVVLLPEIEEELCVAAVEQKIRERMTAAYLVDGATVHLTLSIGSAVYPEQAKDQCDLIQLADSAMYRAKVANNGTLVEGLAIGSKRSLKNAEV